MILTIICPTYNEEKYIEKTIQSFLQQKFHSFSLEILICDGMSNDGTREIVKKIAELNSNVRLVDNLKRKTPYAFNIGLKQASGDYIAILGAHSIYNDNYLQVCFDKLKEMKAVGCSGRIITKAANDYFEAKLCEWVSLSSFGVSSNSFRLSKEGYVDTIGYPIFEKQPLLDLGGYNEGLVRNQDNDMNQRLVDAGYRLYSTWQTQCYYHPPSTIKKLFKYAYTNGFWNANSYFTNRKSMKWHHFIPLFFTCTLLILFLVGILGYIFFGFMYIHILLLFIISLHLFVGLITTFFIKEKSFLLFRNVALPFVFFGFHFSYGLGTLKCFYNKMVKKVTKKM